MTVEPQVVDFERIGVPATGNAEGVEELTSAILQAGGSAELLAVRETGFDAYEIVDPAQHRLYWAMRRGRDQDPDRFDQVWVVVVDADSVQAVLAQRPPAHGTASADTVGVAVSLAVREVLRIPGPEYPSMIDVVEFFNGPESQIQRLLAEVYPSGSANRARALRAASQKQRFATIADIQAVKTSSKRPTAVISAAKLLDAIVVLRRRGATLLG